MLLSLRQPQTLVRVKDGKVAETTNLSDIVNTIQMALVNDYLDIHYDEHKSEWILGPVHNVLCRAE